MRSFTLRASPAATRSEEHTSELQSRENLVCRLLLENKKADCESFVCYRQFQAQAVGFWKEMLHLWDDVSRLGALGYILWLFFFFNDTATTEIYTLSLHDALPI